MQHAKLFILAAQTRVQQQRSRLLCGIPTRAVSQTQTSTSATAAEVELPLLPAAHTL
jgi:hypothetical protein